MGETMSARAFKFERNVSPFSDGSGYGARATVEQTDEGPMLTVEMIYRISIADWPVLRKAIDDMVALAEVANASP